MENMEVMTSVGRDEIGASALRRCLSARMDSSNDLISASMAFSWYSREFADIVEVRLNILTVLLLKLIAFFSRTQHNVTGAKRERNLPHLDHACLGLHFSLSFLAQPYTSLPAVDNVLISGSNDSTHSLAI
jgi:hypothetical protein